VDRQAGDDPVTGAARALYGGPLETFVEERTRLAAELRAAGDRASAAAVAKLPRPTLSAWVVNQLARKEREAVRELGEASARLRQAQLEMVASGEREGFAAATAARREALAALRASGEAILTGAGHPATPAVLERISRNLRAMVAGEQIAAQIEAGQLARDLEGEGLAGDLTALAAALLATPRPAPAPPPKPGKASKPAAPHSPRDEARERAALEKEIARLGREVADAEVRARQASGRASKARLAADEAAADARRADEEATRAEAEAAAARDKLAAAESARARARAR
jgi:hypothetical protein